MVFLTGAAGLEREDLLRGYFSLQTHVGCFLKQFDAPEHSDHKFLHSMQKRQSQSQNTLTAMYLSPQGLLMPCPGIGGANKSSDIFFRSKPSP